MLRVIFLILCFGSLESVGAQSASQGQSDAIRQALVRIARSNVTVENAVYDGMTYHEVLRVLARENDPLAIQFRGNPNPNSMTLDFYSPVGRYYLHWSGGLYDNPVVVGYSMGLDGPMRHNELQ